MIVYWLFSSVVSSAAVSAVSSTASSEAAGVVSSASSSEVATILTLPLYNSSIAIASGFLPAAPSTSGSAPAISCLALLLVALYETHYSTIIRKY